MKPGDQTSTTADCQTCNGKGEYGPVHVNRGDQPHEWVESMKCHDCDGTGQWSEERHAAWERGQRMRRERIERRESLLTVSTRMGITPSQLSAIEHGRGPQSNPTEK